MKSINAIPTLLRLRHTGQIVGIVSILSVKNSGITYQSLFSILSFLCLSVTLFSFDDAKDHLSDMIVHKDRVIPQGKLTSKQAYIIGVITLGLGLIFASILTFNQFVLYIFEIILGCFTIFVNMRSEMRAILVGTSIFLIFPFSASINLKSTIFGLIVALPHIAGSISKDFIHSSGDRKIGIIPPKDRLKNLISIFFIISGVIILLPALLNLVVWYYLPLILPTFISCIILSYKVYRRKYREVYLYGGIGMISTLIAILISG